MSSCDFGPPNQEIASQHNLTCLRPNDFISSHSTNRCLINFEDVCNGIGCGIFFGPKNQKITSQANLLRLQDESFQLNKFNNCGVIS